MAPVKEKRKSHKVLKLHETFFFWGGADVFDQMNWYYKRFYQTSKRKYSEFDLLYCCTFNILRISILKIYFENDLSKQMKTYKILKLHEHFSVNISDQMSRQCKNFYQSSKRINPIFDLLYCSSFSILRISKRKLYFENSLFKHYTNHLFSHKWTTLICYLTLLPYRCFRNFCYNGQKNEKVKTHNSLWSSLSTEKYIVNPLLIPQALFDRVIKAP